MSNFLASRVLIGLIVTGCLGAPSAWAQRPTPDNDGPVVCGPDDRGNLRCYTLDEILDAERYDATSLKTLVALLATMPEGAALTNCGAPDLKVRVAPELPGDRRSRDTSQAAQLLSQTADSCQEESIVDFRQGIPYDDQNLSQEELLGLERLHDEMAKVYSTDIETQAFNLGYWCQRFNVCHLAPSSPFALDKEGRKAWCKSYSRGSQAARDYLVEEEAKETAATADNRSWLGVIWDAMMDLVSSDDADAAETDTADTDAGTPPGGWSTPGGDPDPPEDNGRTAGGPEQVCARAAFLLDQCTDESLGGWAQPMCQQLLLVMNRCVDPTKLRPSPDGPRLICADEEDPAEVRERQCRERQGIERGAASRLEGRDACGPWNLAELPPSPADPCNNP